MTAKERRDIDSALRRLIKVARQLALLELKHANSVTPFLRQEDRELLVQATRKATDALETFNEYRVICESHPAFEREHSGS